MKSLLALAIGATLIFPFVNVLAGEKPYVAKDNEELYGTWVNPNYSSVQADGASDQKIIFRTDMTFELFRWLLGKEVCFWTGPYRITDKWTDSKANIWYKIHWEYIYNEQYRLFKISNSGKKCEFVNDPIEYGYPKKIDPESISYRVYYRKRR
jgi:hypothetical protein